MINPKLRSHSLIPTLTLVMIAAIHCDRGVEPFDESEAPRTPNLTKIFPEGAKERAPGNPMGAMGAAAGGRGMAAPAESPSPAGSSTLSNAAGATIRGTVEIADTLYGERPANGLLFIIARTQPAGPPLAVLRVPNPTFPYTFEIGQAQVMIPSLTFGGEVSLSARLDSDGNAMTKLPGDLVGSIEQPLSPGAEGAVLVLDERL